MTISLPPELAARLEDNAAKEHSGKRSRAIAALIENGITKSGESVACRGNVRPT